jgi:multiple sugar transport system ATP-binding protein
MNLVAGTVAAGPDGAHLLTLGGARFPLPSAPGPLEPGRAVTLGIRPGEARLDPQGPVAMTVELVEPTGAETHCYGRAGGAPFCVAVPHRLDAAPGQELRLDLPEAAVHLFDSQSGARIG